MALARLARAALVIAALQLLLQCAVCVPHGAAGAEDGSESDPEHEDHAAKFAEANANFAEDHNAEAHPEHEAALNAEAHPEHEAALQELEEQETGEQEAPPDARTVLFHNALGVSVEVFWEAEAGGELHSVSVLQPGEELREQSVPGHIFVVKTVTTGTHVYEHTVGQSGEEGHPAEGEEEGEDAVHETVHLDPAAIFRKVTFFSPSSDEAGEDSAFKPVTIFFKSAEGEEQMHARLESPGQSETGVSFGGHSFVARLDDGTEVGSHSVPDSPAEFDDKAETQLSQESLDFAISHHAEL